MSKTMEIRDGQLFDTARADGYHSAQLLLSPVWADNTKDHFGRPLQTAAIPSIKNEHGPHIPGTNNRFEKTMIRCSVNSYNNVAKWGKKGCNKLAVVCVPQTYGHSFYIPATTENLLNVALIAQHVEDVRAERQYN